MGTSAINIFDSNPDYTGVNIHESDLSIEELYKNKKIELPPFYNYHENEYVIVKHEGQSALTRYKNGELHLLDLKMLDKATAVKPRNKEQYFALDALLDDSIKVLCLTGLAGSGKTLLSLSAAIAKMDEKKYKKIILTRPSSQVGKRELGILPGTLEEKFMPFLINYTTNLECIFEDKTQKAKKLNVEHIFSMYNIEIVPLQLIRGASFNDTLILADEIQICNYHEMLTLGTRVSEGSKLVIMGDLNQRDEKIETKDTGLHKFVNDHRVKSSDFTASIKMLKSERGKVSALFSTVFSGE